MQHTVAAPRWLGAATQRMNKRCRARGLLHTGQPLRASWPCRAGAIGASRRSLIRRCLQSKKREISSSSPIQGKNRTEVSRESIARWPWREHANEARRSSVEHRGYCALGRAIQRPFVSRLSVPADAPGRATPPGSFSISEHRSPLELRPAWPTPF